MEQEAVSVKFRKSIETSKEIVSQGYQNFADYINKTYTAHKEMGHNKTLKMAFAKYALVFLNICYMLMSLVMINIGTIGKIVDFNFRYWSGLVMLSSYWIVAGVILLFAAIFGLIGAFKESAVWTTVFGVLMTIVFVVQISSAIITFHFIGKSHSIARDGVRTLMHEYNYDPSQHNRIDWIQRNFQCCGNAGPRDWRIFSVFKKTSNDHNRNTTTIYTPLPDRVPISCCVDGSNYNNLTCDEYYQSGCSTQIREVISESVMIFGSVALAIAVFEILGIVFAFVVAGTIRKTKSFIALQQYGTLANLPQDIGVKSI